MRRFFGSILFLSIIAGAGYLWWQHNANRIITEQVQHIAQRFFVNPDNLSVESGSIQLCNLREGKVKKLVITGNNLALQDGPQLAYAKLVLSDVIVSGPPFRITGIGAGSYTVKVTDQAVTQYIHERKGSIAGLKIVPLSSISLHFLSPLAGANTLLRGEAEIPYLNKRVPMSAQGMLVPSSSTPGQVDFRVQRVKIERISVGLNQVKDALHVINPIVDLSDWPVQSEVTAITTRTGVAIMQGKVTGVNSSLLP